MLNLPPLDHAVFLPFVRLIFQLLARDATISNFESDSVDDIVTAATAAGSSRIQIMPLTDWSSHSLASAGNWQLLWSSLFENVAAATSKSLLESPGLLNTNMKALFAICVLCAYDPMDVWLGCTQQQEHLHHDRRLMNHFIGMTCAAARVTRSLYNTTSKAQAIDHSDAPSGRVRAGSGGQQRAVAAALHDTKCVCLHWVENSLEGCPSAFSDPSSVCISLSDAVAFDAIMIARSPALVRAWWDAITCAYGSTPLIAMHLTRYMQQCRSSAGLCFAIQCAFRCLPTEPLVVCMHRKFSCHNAPYYELKSLVNRTAQAWDRAAKISESYSIRETAVRDKYSVSSSFEPGRDHSVTSSSSTAAALAFQLAWLPSLDRERVIFCINSACTWLMTPPSASPSASDQSSADPLPPLRDLALIASSHLAHRTWPPSALRALLAAAVSPRASLSSFMRCCYGPCAIPKIVREMLPKDFAAFLAGCPQDIQMSLVSGVIGTACEGCLPGMEMNANMIVVPLHLHYSLLGAGITDVWLRGFVASAGPWIDAYASSSSSDSSNSSNISSSRSVSSSSSSNSSSSSSAPRPDTSEFCVDLISSHVLLQIVKLMMFMHPAGGTGAWYGSSSKAATAYVLPSLVCVRFMKRFLRWVVNDCSRSSRSMQRDVDVILWLLLQRPDLASSATSSSPAASAAVEAVPASSSAPKQQHSFVHLAPHSSIIGLRLLYYSYSCDTYGFSFPTLTFCNTLCRYTLDDAGEVSVRPSVLLATRRSSHDDGNLGYSSSFMRVCVGRMMEALVVGVNRSALQLDVDDDAVRSDDVCSDCACAPWYPASILPLAACSHPSSVLDLICHLLTRIDMSTLATNILHDYPRPPAPQAGWMPEALVVAGAQAATVDRDWLCEQQELLVQVVECVAAAALRHAPFRGGQTWQSSSTSAEASSAAASCAAYLSSLTCGHVRLDCTSPCSLDACDVTLRVLFAMKQPKQPAEMESITAHALLPLYVLLFPHYIFVTFWPGTMPCCTKAPWPWPCVPRLLCSFSGCLSTSVSCRIFIG